MRNPARIEEILDKILQIWKLEPDLRLGQLIHNAMASNNCIHDDIHGLEDYELADGLDKYLKQLRGQR